MSKNFSVRPEVIDFKPYTPGLSIEEIKKRYGLSSVIKMASNENPLGTSPDVQKTIQKYAAYAFRYPSSGNPELREALSKTLSLSSNRIIIGNGSDEIIDLLLRVKCRPGLDNILIFDPSFSIYRLQAKLCGLETRKVPLENDFSFNWKSLLAQADQNTALVFVTNPDNPSGYTVKKQDLYALAAKLPAQTLLVVDEAYIDFAQPFSEYSCLATDPLPENMVVLRTFSKMYGLAGLRIGYGVMPPWLAEYILRVKLPFSVNLLAEKAALTALADQSFYEATLKQIIQGRDLLPKELSQRGCQVYPSQANFLLFKPPQKARQIFDSLLAQGIIIRPLDSYGLADCLRVSIGNHRENELFLKNMQKVLNNDL